MTDFNWDVASEAVAPLIAGVGITVALTLGVIVVSLILGLPVAMMRIARFRAVRIIAGAYIDFIRSTPLLLQLIYIYFALPFIGINLDPFSAGFIGLTLHYTAYISEVYRAGIEAVPKGQARAAAALGMRGFQISVVVVLPQAVRIVIPALGNYLVALFKDTSLVSVLSVQELLFAGQLVAARNYDYFTVYTMVFAFYLAIGLPALWFVRFLERKSRSGYSSKKALAKSDDKDVKSEIKGVSA